MKNRLRDGALAHLPLALVAVAVILAADASRIRAVPAGVSALSTELPIWIVLGTLAALHRPLGGRSLGLGAVVLAPVAVRLGALAATLAAAAVVLLAEAVRTAAARWAATRQPIRLGGALDALVPVVGGTLAAASAIAYGLGSGTMAGAAVIYAGVFALLALAASLAAGLDTGPGWARSRGLPLDAAGWLVGGVLTAAAGSIGWGRAGWLVAAFALVAAEAARNVLLRGLSDRRAGSLERMQQANVRILGETSSMADVARQILTECRNVLPVQWFHFELQPAAEGEERRSWSAGPDAVLREGPPRPPERPRALPGFHRRASWRIVEQPLVVGGEVLAVVRIWCDPRRVEPGSEELLETLVPQMASSVHRARLDREAKLDPLTGVPVRRMLDSRLQVAYRRSLDEGTPMAVIMCDVDHFKRINDNYGHAAGDQALILVARALDSQRREGDLCCRYGGEEFTVLLENAGGEAALQLGERLRGAVAALRFEVEGERVPLTLSAGVAAFPELTVKTAGELLLLADEALYAAKETGRNRCLLNRGQGRFRDPSGRVVGSEEGSVEPEVPQFFG